jgi:2-phosphosulfolactate phosphatase
MNKKPTIFTVVSPALLHLYDLNNSVVVIIDVFRATSTIATALYNGAKKVIPVSAVDECIRIGNQLKGSVTAGERDGKVIEGLQYGNSPTEYSEEFIRNKTLVITTTNGTRLLHMALQNGAAEVVTGSFVNLSAVCNYLVGQKKNIILGCSAWKDRFNLEDTLFAGAVLNNIKDHFTVHCDASLMAQSMYLAHQYDLYAFVKLTTHYHRLAAYGLEADLEYCVTADVANVLPYYNGDSLIAG